MLLYLKMFFTIILKQNNKFYLNVYDKTFTSNVFVTRSKCKTEILQKYNCLIYIVGGISENNKS